MRRLQGQNVRSLKDSAYIQSSSVLQPIIDLLQYQVFCERIKSEMTKIVGALRHAGVATKFHFNAVGENGDELVQLLSVNGKGHIGGEATVRVDDRFALMLTHQLPKLTLFIFRCHDQSYSSLHVPFAVNVDRSPVTSDVASILNTAACTASA